MQLAQYKDRTPPPGGPPPKSSSYPPCVNHFEHHVRKKYSETIFVVQSMTPGTVNYRCTIVLPTTEAARDFSPNEIASSISSNSY